MFTRTLKLMRALSVTRDFLGRWVSPAKPNKLFLELVCLVLTHFQNNNAN